MAYDWQRKMTTTAESAKISGIKVLVYGAAGSGKTHMIKTCTPEDPSKTLMISAESGTLALEGVNIPEAPVSSFAEFKGLYDDLRAWIAGENIRGENWGAFPYEWIAIDSITEIIDQCLAVKTSLHKDDTWAIYRTMKDDVLDILKKFRDLQGVNVYFSCEMERDKTEAGALLYQPQVAGNAVAKKLPYLFDLVFPLRAQVDPQDKEKVHRFLQTRGDSQYYAKDRSGKLNAFEAPDLGAIREKILGA